MRLAAVALLAAVLLATASAASAAGPLTIRVNGHGFVTQIGALNVRANPTVAGATRAFGRPSSIRPGRDVCRVRWNGLRLQTVFTSFGRTNDMCAEGFLQTAVTHSSRFRTWRGLRVGMASNLIPDLHPGARFRGGRWVLAAQSQIGSGASPTVSALVQDGRVSGFDLWVGGAGD